jgi:hypothetical protein
MDLEKFYFQYLNIPFDQADISALLKKYPLIESRFDAMNIQELEQLMPSIFAWFKEQNLEATQSFLINHQVNFKQDIHADYTEPGGPKLAINFPLNQKAAESLTRLYDAVCNEKSHVTRRSENLVSFSKFNPDQVIKITEYKSTSPVILNITKPHSAWNNTEEIRGILTFRFKDDPIHLIKEQA